MFSARKSSRIITKKQINKSHDFKEQQMLAEQVDNESIRLQSQDVSFMNEEREGDGVSLHPAYPIQVTQQEAETGKKQVLVIESNIFEQIALKGMFDQYQIGTDLVKNGREALQMM